MSGGPLTTLSAYVSGRCFTAGPPSSTEQIAGDLAAWSFGEGGRRGEGCAGHCHPPALRPLALVLSPSREPGSGCCDTLMARAEERQAVSGLYTLTAGMFSF